MPKKPLSSNDALWFGEWQLGRVNVEERAYGAKVRALSAEMALQGTVRNFVYGRP